MPVRVRGGGAGLGTGARVACLRSRGRPVQIPTARLASRFAQRALLMPKVYHVAAVNSLKSSPSATTGGKGAKLCPKTVPAGTAEDVFFVEYEGARPGISS